MNEYNFNIPCVPPKATAQSTTRMVINKKTGKPFPVKNKKGQQVEHELLILLMSNAPEAPLAGALSLDITFVYPWRKSEPKYKREMGQIPMTVTPDLDNLMKLFLDQMQKALFIQNDSQISDLRCRKFWGDLPRIEGRLRVI